MTVSKGCGLRGRALMVVTLGVAAAGIGIANAQIPSANTDTIFGCASKSTGSLRVLDHDIGQQCTDAEKPVQWSQAPVQGALTPVRAPLAGFSASSTSAKASNIMVAQDPTRVKGWNNYTSTLRETTDEGVTWSDIHTFSGQSMESVTPLANGELLVSTTDGSAQRRMYLSSGLPSLRAQATWSQVLAASAIYAKFTSAWSISTSENIVVVNEYGPKAGEKWAGSTSPIPEGKNARYTYLSLDYGKTWRTIFDLNAYLSTRGRSTNGQHLHGVAWDPWWDRIWVSFGDNAGGAGSNGILYSDDLGASWKTAHFYSGPSPYTQVVGILPMPRCILFTGDMEPSGILRIDRSQGKENSSSYRLTTAYDHPDGNVKHLAQAISYTSRVGDDPVALFGFGAEGTSAPSFILATFDGYDIRKVWQDTSPQAAGYGIRNIVGPTLRGNLIVASNDQRVAGMWTQWKGAAPGY